MKNIDVPNLNIPRVVIIGAGFGGLEMVRRFKGKEVQVVLLDRNNYHTFQPLLYQVATAGLEADAIAFPVRKTFKDYPNFYFRLATVERISPEERKVVTNIGELSYDYLVVATGSKTNYFGMMDVKRNAMPLKTINQSLELRSMMLQHFELAVQTDDLKLRESYMNFVIVGAGPTGVELAGALAELRRFVLPSDYPELDVRRMQIHLVEAGGRILPALSEKSSQKAMDYLKELGVNVWLNTQVTSYDGMTMNAKMPEGKQLQLTAKNMIWSAGVMGNKVMGLPEEVVLPNNRILVDEHCQVQNHENIFAIGDVACLQCEDYPRGHPMVAPVAIQMGTTVADNIHRKIKGKAPKSFKYFDKGSMATVGKNKAVVEIKAFKAQGFFAWFIWMFVHIMSLLGKRNKAVVFVNWFWNYFNYDQGNRLIVHPFVKRRLEKQEQITLG